MYISPMVSTTYCSLKAVSLGHPLVYGRQVECTFQEQGRGEEPLTAQAHANNYPAIMSRLRLPPIIFPIGQPLVWATFYR